MKWKETPKYIRYLQYNLYLRLLKMTHSNLSREECDGNNAVSAQLNFRNRKSCWHFRLSESCCLCWMCVYVKPKQSHWIRQCTYKVKYLSINLSVTKCRFMIGCVNNSWSVCVGSSAFWPKLQSTNFIEQTSARNNHSLACNYQ